MASVWEVEEQEIGSLNEKSADGGFAEEHVEQIILIYKWIDHFNIKTQFRNRKNTQGHHGLFHGVITFNSDFTANLVCPC